MAPLVCKAQLQQWAMNQQHMPVPAGPRATALCSVNIRWDSEKVHKGDKARKAIGMTGPISSYYNHIRNLLTTILTSPAKSCSKSRA